jgi:hypothetical protein
VLRGTRTYPGGVMCGGDGELLRRDKNMKW